MTILIEHIAAFEGPRYLAIAQGIGGALKAGALGAGDRLPTQRALADALGVTVGTVTRGYAEAERRGLVQGEVGRGTFIRSQRSPRPELWVPEAVARGFIDLGLNLPAPDLDTELAAALRGLSERSDLQSLLSYQPAAGHGRHRRAGAQWIGLCDLSVPPERVVVTAGAQHALTVLLMTQTQPGDVLLTGSLTYPGIKTLARGLGRRLEPVAMDAEGILPEALDEACRRHAPAALYCMPTLQNPTAAIMGPARREAIAAVARAHGLLVFEDDLYRLILSRPAPPPLAALIPERTFYIAGCSKLLAGGLRISFVAAPAPQVEAIAQGVAATLWMAPPLSAEIVALWLEDGTAEAVLGRKRLEAAQRHRIALGCLGPSVLGAGEVSQHVLFPLPEPWRGEQLAFQALRRGVGVTPAEAFFVGKGRAPRAVRISLASAGSQEALERGLGILLQVLQGSPEGEGIV